MMMNINEKDIIVVIMSMMIRSYWKSVANAGKIFLELSQGKQEKKKLVVLIDDVVIVLDKSKSKNSTFMVGFGATGAKIGKVKIIETSNV